MITSFWPRGTGNWGEPLETSVVVLVVVAPLHNSLLTRSTFERVERVERESNCARYIIASSVGPQLSLKMTIVFAVQTAELKPVKPLGMNKVPQTKPSGKALFGAVFTQTKVDIPEKFHFLLFIQVEVGNGRVTS